MARKITAEIERERQALAADLEALGVPWDKTCVHTRTVRDPSSMELVEKECGRAAVIGMAYCGYHRSRSLVGTVEATQVLRDMKAVLTRDLLPKALLAVEEVLDDPDASHQNLLRAATIVMDRGGMPAGQDVNLNAVVAVAPPRDLLEQALADIRERLGGDVVEGEVVEDDAVPTLAAPEPEPEPETRPKARRPRSGH